MSNGDIISGITIPQKFMEYLHDMGLPRHVTKLSIVIEKPSSPIEIECSFLAYENGQPVINNGEFVEETKSYHLVEKAPSDAR
jgi:hypothetical protein